MTLLSLQGVQSPLYASCQVGNIEMVQLLVHHHAAIDQPCDVSNAQGRSQDFRKVGARLCAKHAKIFRLEATPTN